MPELVDDDYVAVVRNWAYFDADWYLNEYRDVDILGMDPAYHYLWLGARMGRKPSVDFGNFQNRYHKVDDIIREIGKNPLPRPSMMDGGSFYEGVRPQPAIFIEPGRADMAPVDTLRVAVHLHLYYADLAEEIAEYLRLIPCTFDLYISVSSEQSRRTVEPVFSKIPNASRVDIRFTQNKGRDIGPFLVEFGDVLSKYDVLAHIHSKKSTYNNGSTDGWRQYMLGSLFENPDNISYLINSLYAGEYGIIYPQCFHNLPYVANTWLANIELARSWAPRFGVQALPDGYFDFPVGSMFWAKVDAIRPLLEAALDWCDFPHEQGQTDGTLAHCIERMIGVVSTARDFKHGVIRDTQKLSWSRWRLDQFVDRPLAHLHNLVAAPAIKIVAFDIFDTLLMRPFLDPDYVKHLLQAEYAQVAIPDFLENRRLSESRAREDNGRDVDIYAIYRHFLMSNQHVTEAVAPDREIALETFSVRPRSDVQALLRYAVQSGKKVVLASDMFLPRAVIEGMLERCGITGWHALYLSCDVGVRKDSGKLYDHILAVEHIAPHEMVMVGDNERSDFQIPADMGIGTIHILKPVAMMRAIPRLANIIPDNDTMSVGDQFLFGAIANENFGPITYSNFSPDTMFGTSARAIGYSLLGPIMVAFSEWLLDRARDHGIERLYFLAREGKFLKRAFEGWQAGSGIHVDCDYLLISRRAVTVPCIGTLSQIEDIAASNDFHGASMTMFLNERFGTVLDDDIWRACEQAGLWSRDNRLTVMNGDIDHIRAFLHFIAPQIIEQADRERIGAMHYYQRMGLTDTRRAAVVDIGYSATIQRHLITLLDRDIHGLYMMTNNRGTALGDGGNVISAGCFIEGAQREASASPLFLHSFLLEKMLSADDEQVIHYSSSGEPCFREKGAYMDSGADVRYALQEGAMNFVRDAARFRDETGAPLRIDRLVCETLFVQFVNGMSSEERDILSSLALDDFYCGRGIVTD